MPKNLLFKVLMGVSGHEYAIYDNGEIEGFGKGALIFNYYPALLTSDRVQRAKGTSSDPSCPTSCSTSDLDGAGQTSPP